MGATRIKRHWATPIGLLAIAAAVLGGCWLVRPPALPGTLGAVASRVRTGMSQTEAVALIQASGSDNVDTFYARGESWDGRPFSAVLGGAFDALPPAEQLAWGELEVDDEQGRELVITLGRGGVVTGVRLSSPQSCEGWRYGLWRWVGR